MFQGWELFSLSVSPLIHSWKILRLTWKRRSKLSKWEMAKSKMEYFVGERDLSKDISPLYVHAQRRLVSLRLRWRREFSARRGGEKRSHRKPNTMVISGWVCFGVTSSIRRRKKIRPSSPSTSSIRQLPGIENLLNSLLRCLPPCHLLLCQNFLSLSLSLSFSLSLSSCQLSWLDRRQAFRYLNNPPIRLSLRVGMISQIYSPSTYEE